MKTKAALSLLLFLLAGCASQQQSRNSNPPVFSGQPMNVFGADAAEVWQKQLATKFGIANRGVVRAIRDGIAEVSVDDGKSWKEVKVGAVFTEGSWIRTDSKATADLFIGDNGPVIRLTKGTELRIVRLNVATKGAEKDIDTMLELPKGRILGNVKKLSANSSYLIRTRGGVIQIRGTEFSASADGSFSIEVGHGVIYANGQTHEVREGQKFSPPWR